ncbi:hypothetical protein EJB05_35567, partial [Eragrostis curvula]
MELEVSPNKVELGFRFPSSLLASLAGVAPLFDFHSTPAYTDFIGNTRCLAAIFVIVEPTPTSLPLRQPTSTSLAISGDARWLQSLPSERRHLQIRAPAPPLPSTPFPWQALRSWELRLRFTTTTPRLHQRGLPPAGTNSGTDQDGGQGVDEEGRPDRQLQRGPTSVGPIYGFKHSFLQSNFQSDRCRERRLCYRMTSSDALVVVIRQSRAPRPGVLDDDITCALFFRSAAHINLDG